MKNPKRAKCKECERLQDELDVESAYYERTIEILKKHREAFLRFFDDVNLILSGSRDTLCGSKWINAASLLEARNRYAKAMEEL